jgi:hypothetical protein
VVIIFGVVTIIVFLHVRIFLRFELDRPVKNIFNFSVKMIATLISIKSICNDCRGGLDFRPIYLLADTCQIKYHGD